MAFYIAASAGLLGGLWYGQQPKLAVIIGADVFFLLYLVLTLGGFGKLSPAYLKRNAARADMPVWIIYLVTLATVIVALVCLFLLLNQQPKLDRSSLGLTLVSVPLGWFTIHTMAALHYAHLYWQPETTAEGARHSRQTAREGLDFPGNGEPAGTDFLYFSYVLGMTAQTSDVDVTSSAMRKACLIHSVVAFFYNTVLVAAAVNVVVTLANPQPPTSAPKTEQIAP
jgi:uncharacterized membrane protein